MGKHVLITGASGMIGGLILDQALAHPEVSAITSLVRKPGKERHAKLKEVVVKDFANPEAYAGLLTSIDAVRYCIGVYTGAVPREVFHQITVDYPLALGQALEKENPQVAFCLLSGQGADRKEKSRMAFALDKGKAENGLAAMQLGRVHFFRPAYIYPVTPRHEPNFTYRLSRMLYKPVLRHLGKNMSITSEQLAQGMLKVALGGSTLEVLENRDILEALP
ncbi:MAG: NAD-dependent epimerase/dehydratase family protein [Salibacteraceae bacterium]